MKSKVLVVLMTMLIAVGLVGCGGSDTASNRSSVPPETRPTESSIVESVPEESTEAPSNETERLSNETAESSEVMDDMEDTEAGAGENSLYFSIWSYSVDRYEMWTVYKLDLDTYLCEPISSFKFNLHSPTYERVEHQMYQHFPYFMLAESRFIYSNDFSKCAANYLLDSGERHAGWLNDDGSFTDVTEAVGEASKSDFETAKHFASMGFTDDGRFIYFNEDNKTFHYVYINDYGQSYDDDDSLIPEFKQLNFPDYTYRFSDWWTDSEHYLGYFNGSVRHHDYEFGAIIDINNGENYELFFPEDSPRYSWDMLLSPDEKSVIFLSSYQDYAKQYEYELYIMDLETREPTLVPYDISKQGIRLLDWR